MVFPFSHGFPMVFLWVSHGDPVPRAPAVAPVPPVPARDAAVEGSAVSAVSAPEPARNDGDPEDPGKGSRENRVWEICGSI